eukprot:780817-Rhodomonas_salina.1
MKVFNFTEGPYQGMGLRPWGDVNESGTEEGGPCPSRRTPCRSCSTPFPSRSTPRASHVHFATACFFFCTLYYACC